MKQKTLIGLLLLVLAWWLSRKKPRESVTSTISYESTTDGEPITDQPADTIDNFLMGDFL